MAVRAVRGPEQRRRHTLAVLLCVALVAGVMAVPAVEITTARPAAAATALTLQTCGGPHRPWLYWSCLDPDIGSTGLTRPAPPTITAPVAAAAPNGYPARPDWVSQDLTINGQALGGLCPTGAPQLPEGCAFPLSWYGDVPILSATGAYGGDLPRPLSDYWIIVTGPGETATSPTPSSGRCAGQLAQCTLRITYTRGSNNGRTLRFEVANITSNSNPRIETKFFRYQFPITLGQNGPPPVAAFSTTGLGSTTDPLVLRAASSDPSGELMTHEWDFGDGTPMGNGILTTHAYAKPGTYTVTLRSKNQSGAVGSVTQQVVVKPPKLQLSIDLQNAAPPLDPAKPVVARVTVGASSDGLGAINGITFTGGDALKVAPDGAFTIADGLTPPVPVGGFDLQPGATRTFDLTLTPKIVGRYNLSAQVTGTDETNKKQTADASSPGEIGSALDMSIVLDPPFAKQAETVDGTKTPVDVTATITLRNTTALAMDKVTLTSLRVDRTKAGQLLAVTQTGGADPGPDGYDVGALAAGQERKVTATFRATDNAEVEFSAQATGKLSDGRTEIGSTRKRWSVKPTYLLGLTTRVTNPAGGALLPAGELVRISGTVKNLSTTASIEVGALYPTLSGNAGAMSFAWGADGPDPQAAVPGAPITLGPGDTKDFTVRFLTTWSDPTGSAGPKPSGGTIAKAEFTPWGLATMEDGTQTVVTPDLVRSTPADLSKRVAIDDSITIPTFSYTAFGGAVMVGGVQGVLSGTAALVNSTIDLVTKVPYTVLHATSEFQEEVWNSFTPAEREAFANDAGLMVAAILARNYDFAKQGSATLFQQAKDGTLKTMTEMANNWEVGDYTSTTRLWTKYSADALTQVLVPVALSKMAASPKAAAALVRAQEALQAKMAPVLDAGVSATRMEELTPVLTALASGTELTPAQIEVLYGITAEELAALEKLSEEFGVLMTVRSRHASSIEWIERFQAMLKPETLKIKTVSALDVELLGYREGDVGSLVFRKPDVLKTFDAGGGDLGALINDLAVSKGYQPGTVDWQNAVKRIADRCSEWRKWEKYYKRWDAQGWIDVSMNYKGNAIADPIRKGPSSLGVAPLESGKFQGFRLRPIGNDNYVVEMLNNKVGRWVQVTGDIDPIAFTHLDGTPLTAAEHAALLDAMAKNPLLQTQHGESATFTGGGLKFIKSQFKPNEPALQIAPGGHAPRAVRLNGGDVAPDGSLLPGKSVWNSPFDYNLSFDGGFVYSGSYVPRTAIPRPPIVIPSEVVPAALRPRPLPKAVTGDPNVGRCVVNFDSTAVDAYNAVVDIYGKIVNLGSDGRSTQPSPLQSQCFSEGPPVQVKVKPVTGLSAAAKVGATELPIPEGDPWLASAGDGLRVGDVVTIGAGTPNAETHEIIAFGSIIIAGGLKFDHPAGDLIVVTKGAPAPSTPPTTTSPTTTPPTTHAGTTPPAATNQPTAVTAKTVAVKTVTVTSATPTTPAGVLGSSASNSTPTGQSGTSGSSGAQDGSLAYTGGDATEGAGLGLGMVVFGLLCVLFVDRRRRAGEPRRQVASWAASHPCRGPTGRAPSSRASTLRIRRSARRRAGSGC